MLREYQRTFLWGLKDEIVARVRMFKPRTLHDAIELYWIFGWYDDQAKEESKESKVWWANPTSNIVQHNPFHSHKLVMSSSNKAGQ